MPLLVVMDSGMKKGACGAEGSAGAVAQSKSRSSRSRLSFGGSLHSPVPAPLMARATATTTLWGWRPCSLCCVGTSSPTPMGSTMAIWPASTFSVSSLERAISMNCSSATQTYRSSKARTLLPRESGIAHWSVTASCVLSSGTGERGSIFAGGMGSVLQKPSARTQGDQPRAFWERTAAKYGTPGDRWPTRRSGRVGSFSSDAFTMISGSGTVSSVRFASDSRQRTA
mmetsp:Transcript_106225/g.338312  ORF Transcript_106225/g.338312 Transcript_106225/m.338312 type:complete len:227 (-) Transcript_106225:244-924(-)